MLKPSMYCKNDTPFGADRPYLHSNVTLKKGVHGQDLGKRARLPNHDIVMILCVFIVVIYE